MRPSAQFLTPCLMLSLMCAPGLVCVPAEGQPLLRLKSRRTLSELTPPEGLRHAAGAEEEYLVAQFAHEPRAEDLSALQRKGFRAVSYLPDQALIVAGPAGTDLRDVGASLIAALEGRDKLSPALTALGPSEMTLALVVLHEAAAVVRSRMLLSTFGLAAREHPDLLATHLLVSGPVSQLQRAAGLGEIAYILPATKEMKTGAPARACQGVVAPVAGLRAAAELSASFGDGWDGAGLGRANLSYYIGALTPLHPVGMLTDEIRKALAAWSDVVDVNFLPTTSPRQRRSIDVTFEQREHGDGFPFDGPGKMLAHTYYPPPTEEPLAGDLHFDIEEPWRIGSDPDVFSVALHELGHALGLAHSDDPSSVMYPYYRQWAALTASDIESIRQLYKSRAAVVEPPAEPEVPEPPVLPPVPPPVLPPLPPLPPATPPTNPETPEEPVTPPVTPPVAPEPGTPDATAPSLTIDWPASTVFATSSDRLEVRGTASDDRALKSVTWESSAGDSGTAQGTARFECRGIPLYRGTNRITIRAWDEGGNSSWRALVVTRR